MSDTTAFADDPNLKLELNAINTKEKQDDENNSKSITVAEKEKQG